VLLRTVEAGSAAATAGLLAGDVIVGANRSRVSSITQLRAAARGAASLVLQVRRAGALIIVPLR
jgi:S1-C subfamily serine protease